MNYLYHQVPEKIEGSFLMPLNMLRFNHRSVYETEMKKYENRPNLPHKVIPHFNCLWNDVLHLTAVHPVLIDNALKECGSEKGLNNKKWYKIRTDFLYPDCTIVWLYPRKVDEQNGPNAFVPFKISDLEGYNSIKEDTKKYYREQIKLKNKPLLFHLVPHILYYDQIPINKLEIMEI